MAGCGISKVNMFLIWIIFNLLGFAATAYANKEILVVIMSQNTDMHAQLGQSLRVDIIKQQTQIKLNNMVREKWQGYEQEHVPLAADYIVNVRLLHEIANYPGDWTMLPVMPKLIEPKANLINDNTAWLILCDVNTHINLSALLMHLANEDHNKLTYMGHALHDEEASIIHHFAFYQNPKWFPYPMLQSGIVFSVPLVKRLAALAVDRAIPRHTEFAIDATHELARFIYDNIQRQSSADKQNLTKTVIAKGQRKQKTLTNAGTGSNGANNTLPNSQNGNFEYEIAEKLIMKKAAYICGAFEDDANNVHTNKCAMHARIMSQRSAGICAEFANMHGIPINYNTTSAQSIYFAIKTCKKFHKERIPIIQATWAAQAQHKRYFSDVADAQIPTIRTGIANVDTGHCAKTMAILKYAIKDIKQKNQKLKTNEAIHWLFLADDDTLVSVSALGELLACFNPHHDIYLGERYGYRLHAYDGFNYVTGGGGIVLSLSVIKQILKYCTCPSKSAPDDMILGSCLHNLHVPAIHTPRFHQANAKSYPSEVLHMTAPITFHKFTQIDPVTEYQHWFAHSDTYKIKLPKHGIRHERHKLHSKNSNNVTLAYGRHVPACEQNVHEQIDCLESSSRSKERRVERSALSTYFANIFDCCKFYQIT